jgi:hypothetical protein
MCLGEVARVESQNSTTTKQSEIFQRFTPLTRPAFNEAPIAASDALWRRATDPASLLKSRPRRDAMHGDAGDAQARALVK